MLRNGGDNARDELDRPTWALAHRLPIGGGE
jgi:hypothetical protein